MDKFSKIIFEMAKKGLQVTMRPVVPTVDIPDVSDELIIEVSKAGYNKSFVIDKRISFQMIELAFTDIIEYELLKCYEEAAHKTKWGNIDNESKVK